MSSRRWRSGGVVQADHVEAVEQILAEAALADLACQIAVRRGDHAHVDADGLVAADALELALLQHAQQLRLRRGRDLADLVEEQRAAVGLLEAAVAARGRAGERALLVAEQLALEHAFGERAAVDAARTGRRARRLHACSARATSSLPVPLSPSTSTDASRVGDLAHEPEQLLA